MWQVGPGKADCCCYTGKQDVYLQSSSHLVSSRDTSAVPKSVASEQRQYMRRVFAWLTVARAIVPAFGVLLCTASCCYGLDARRLQIALGPSSECGEH
jgi:hypothetical protein